MNHNRLCNIEDFRDPELVEIIRDVFRHEVERFTPTFPQGAEYRKYWEIGMSVRAMRSYGVLRSDAKALGIGAGTETTLFYLTNHVSEVHATDIYYDASAWQASAPAFMLVEPQRVAPYDYRRDRLVVRHMDGRVLDYPDEWFDTVFSSGSIEHFGSFADVAAAAYEMGRVLKPGGLLTLSTEFQLAGPSGGQGWETTLLFDHNTLTRYIIEASGLEPVDTPDLTASEETLGSRRDFSYFAAAVAEQVSTQGLYPRVNEVLWPSYPHILLVQEGYVFGSVHVTLRKPSAYPHTDNAWARPSADLRAQIEKANSRRVREVVRRMRSKPSGHDTLQRLLPQVPPVNDEAYRSLHQQVDAWNKVHARTLSIMPGKQPAWRKPLRYVLRLMMRIRSLGSMFRVQANLNQAMLRYFEYLDQRQTTLEQQQVAAANEIADLSLRQDVLDDDVSMMKYD